MIELLDLQLPSPLESTIWEIEKKRYQIHVKRDDLIHPLVSGNKFRKLSEWIKYAHDHSIKHLVSEGGLWSNHLLALAALGQQLRFTTSAFIRANEEELQTSAHAQKLQDLGMQLFPLVRHEFHAAAFRFEAEFGDDKTSLWIPMGGEGELGTAGCKQILEETGYRWDCIWICAGTGTTALGLAKTLQDARSMSELKVVSAISNQDFTNELQARLSQEYPLAQVILPKGPRFGKFSEEQFNIGQDWYRQTSILPDPIYQLKLLEQLGVWLKEKNPNTEARILFIHTGGLTGWDGFPAFKLRLGL